MKNIKLDFNKTHFLTSYCHLILYCLDPDPCLDPNPCHFNLPTLSHLAGLWIPTRFNFHSMIRIGIQYADPDPGGKNCQIKTDLDF